jgi:hypothetical protein
MGAWTSGVPIDANSISICRSSARLLMRCDCRASINCDIQPMHVRRISNATSGMFSLLDILNPTNENRGQTAPSGCGEGDNLNDFRGSRSRENPK